MSKFQKRNSYSPMIYSAKMNISKNSELFASAIKWPFKIKLEKLAAYFQCKYCDCDGWKSLKDQRNLSYVETNRVCEKCSHDLDSHAEKIKYLKEDVLNDFIKMCIDIDYLDQLAEEKTNSEEMRLNYQELCQVLKESAKQLRKPNVNVVFNISPDEIPKFENPNIEEALRKLVNHSFSSNKDAMAEIRNLVLNHLNEFPFQSISFFSQFASSSEEERKAYVINLKRWMFFCKMPQCCCSLTYYTPSSIFGYSYLKSCFRRLKMQIFSSDKAKLKPEKNMHLQSFLNELQKEISNPSSPVWVATTYGHPEVKHDYLKDVSTSSQKQNSRKGEQKNQESVFSFDSDSSSSCVLEKPYVSSLKKKKNSSQLKQRKEKGKKKTIIEEKKSNTSHSRSCSNSAASSFRTDKSLKHVDSTSKSKISTRKRKAAADVSDVKSRERIPKISQVKQTSSQSVKRRATSNSSTNTRKKKKNEKKPVPTVLTETLEILNYECTDPIVNKYEPFNQPTTEITHNQTSFIPDSERKTINDDESCEDAPPPILECESTKIIDPTNTLEYFSYVEQAIRNSPKSPKDVANTLEYFPCAEPTSRNSPKPPKDAANTLEYFSYVEQAIRNSSKSPKDTISVPEHFSHVDLPKSRNPPRTPINWCGFRTEHINVQGLTCQMLLNKTNDQRTILDAGYNIDEGEQKKINWSENTYKKKKKKNTLKKKKMKRVLNSASENNIKRKRKQKTIKKLRKRKMITKFPNTITFQEKENGVAASTFDYFSYIETVHRNSHFIPKDGLSTADYVSYIEAMHKNSLLIPQGNRINMSAFVNNPYSISLDERGITSTMCKRSCIFDKVVNCMNETESSDITHAETMNLEFLNFSGPNYFAMDEICHASERKGEIRLHVISNSKRKPNANKKKLLEIFASIIESELPDMDENHIRNFIFNLKRKHVSKNMILLGGNVVYGGICFRIFKEQRFTEIVFIAVLRTENRKGYGTYMMKRLKDYLHVKYNINHILTYADTSAGAIPFFRAQGFSEISNPKKYEQYIGIEYVNAVMMEFWNDTFINHSNLKYETRRQIKALKILMKMNIKLNNTEESKRSRLYLAINNFDVKEIPIEKIPGIDDICLVPFRRRRHLRGSQEVLKDQLANVIDALLINPFACYFWNRPVEFGDYSTFFPMSLKTVRRRIEHDYYCCKKLFISDMRRIFNNCRRFHCDVVPFIDIMENHFKIVLAEFATYDFRTMC